MVGSEMEHTEGFVMLPHDVLRRPVVSNLTKTIDTDCNTITIATSAPLLPPPQLDDDLDNDHNHSHYQLRIAASRMLLCRFLLLFA